MLLCRLCCLAGSHSPPSADRCSLGCLPPHPLPLQVPTKVARGINQVPTKLAYGVKALADGDDNKEQLVSDVFPKPESA